MFSACDIFGIGLVNNKLIPDKLAEATGLTVYVPDLLEGDYPPADIAMITKPVGQLSYFAQFTAFAGMMYSFITKIGVTFIRTHTCALSLFVTLSFADIRKKIDRLT